MADFYSELQDVASEVLGEFKQGTILLIRSSEAAADVNTPWTPGTTTNASYVLDAVAEGVKQRFIDGTLVNASERKITCSPVAKLDGVSVTITPTTKDVISIDGQRHEIKRVDQIPAAGIPVIFEIFVAA